MGLVLENCELPFANHGHVVLGDPSPVLFYPISSTEVRCLVDVPGEKVPSVSNGEMDRYLKTVVAPQVCVFLNSSAFSPVSFFGTVCKICFYFNLFTFPNFINLLMG